LPPPLGMPKRGISGDEAGQDDVQTLCEERTWFVAENHRRQIRTFLRGPGNSEKYGIIDLFGASAQMSKMWRKAGWDAFAFDIKSNPDHDMTSAKGFWTLCAAAKKLKKKGLIFGGPPCSLYVWISKSIHKRSQENKFVGDTSRLKVRMSNRIVANMVVFLEELSAVKEFFSITEQPSSSEMFKMKNTSAMVRKLKMESVWTWMGLFGHELPKATVLTGNLPSLPSLKRKMTREWRKEFQKRRSKGKLSKFYTRHGDGKVTGRKNLQSTAAYTGPFCRAVYRAWLKDSTSGKSQ